MIGSLKFCVGIALTFVALQTAPAFSAEAVNPESPTGRGALIGGTTKSYMVAAGTTYAAEAGAAIIKAGGNAVDAAVAVELVLSMTEPQSSGVGGGGFMLFWDAAAKQMKNYDGREKAPAAAQEKRFLRPDGAVMGRTEAIVGGKSVGVPGVMRMLEMAHRKHGHLPWARLFEPAVKIAEDGFPIGPRLHELLARDQYLPLWEPTKSFFYLPDGKAKPAGTILKNPAFAIVLHRMAKEGTAALYTGSIAADVVRTVATATRNASDMTVADMANYDAKERTPICGNYRDKKVCTIAPPSSGGISVLQTLGMLERFDMKAMGPESVAAYNAIAEAGRLALADRAIYVADPDFFPVPVKELIAPTYIAQRSKLLDPKGRMKDAPAGELTIKKAMNLFAAKSPEIPATTHFSIVDKDGNAVAMTATIESGFGSKLMSNGFMLNNELTDFSYDDVAQGRTVANRVQGNKRPRSAMAPTLIFDKTGRLEIVIGSPGGPAIPAYVSKTIVALVDWNLSPAEAVGTANIVSGDRLDLEAGTFLEKQAPAFKALGHPVRVGDSGSGLHAIRILPGGGLVGGADPRREGAVKGE